MSAGRKPVSTGAASPWGHPALGRLLPSGRSLLVAFGLVALGVAAYAGARQTAVFSVKRVEVTGSRPFVTRRVEAALAPVTGRSLLALDRAGIEERLASLPDVRLVSYDRSFPHTARIVVTAERPVAVLRRGSDAWLVSERGRVLRRLPEESRSPLPRVWSAGTEQPEDGALVPDEDAYVAARGLGEILAADAVFLKAVKGARSADGELVLVLASGTEVRFGSEDDLALKTAVARSVLGALGEGGARYVDVSVPERPVASDNSQLEG